MDRLQNHTGLKDGPIQTCQKASVRGTDMKLAVTSGPKELANVEMMSVSNEVVMFRTRELHRHRIVKDVVGSDSTERF